MKEKLIEKKLKKKFKKNAFAVIRPLVHRYDTELHVRPPPSWDSPTP